MVGVYFFQLASAILLFHATFLEFPQCHVSGCRGQALTPGWWLSGATLPCDHKQRPSSCTSDLSALRGPSAILATPPLPGLPPAWAPSSHQTARPSPSLNPLTSSLSSPFPGCTPFHTTNNYVLSPLLPSASQLRPQLQCLLSQESCCTQAVPSPRRQFPLLGGIQLPECSPFFTLGGWKGPKRFLSLNI